MFLEQPLNPAQFLAPALLCTLDPIPFLPRPYSSPSPQASPATAAILLKLQLLLTQASALPLSLLWPGTTIGLMRLLKLLEHMGLLELMMLVGLLRLTELLGLM